MSDALDPVNGANKHYRFTNEGYGTCGECGRFLLVRLPMAPLDGPGTVSAMELKYLCRTCRKQIVDMLFGTVPALRARAAELEDALRDVLARNRLTPADHDRIAALLENK